MASRLPRHCTVLAATTLAHVIGGGMKVDDPANAFLVDGYPDAANTAWTGHAGNAGGAAIGFTVWAICMSATTTG